MNIQFKFILQTGFVLLTGLLAQNGAFAQVYPLADGSSLEEVFTLKPSHLDADLADVEATNLRVDGKIVYVTYNTAGSGSRGAFEAIDISDIQHPRPLNTLKYDLIEFADLAMSGNRAYIVGEESLPSHQGAVLKMIDISKPDHLVDLGSLPLNGFSATSINIRGGQAVVSTGDNGSVTILDIFPFALPKIRNQIPFANALFASADHGRFFALGGMGSTQFVSFDSGSLAKLQSVQLSAQTTPSPARFELQNDVAYVNAEKSGLSLIDLNHFSLLSQLALPGTGNGIDVQGDRVFLAQGEAGLYVVNAKDKHAPYLVGNLNFHFAGESTNQVLYYRANHEDDDDQEGCEYLLVANGRGGFRIFRIQSREFVAA